MKGMQPYPFAGLKSPSYTAGGADTVSMETLPATVFDRIAHLVGFYIDVIATPTYTTAPTINGILSILKNLVFFDGANERMNLSAALLRYAYILESGKNIVPDPDTNTGSGNAIRFGIPVFLGPVGAAGSPTDYLLPCSALKSAELRFTFGALTDYSADTTAIASVNIRVSAILVALDNQIRIPPAFERRSFNGSTNEMFVQGKALYHSLALTKQALSAFSAGDVGSVTIDTGRGSVPSIICSSLSGVAQSTLRSGVVTQLRGEPRFATDDNEKTVNLGTPTALVASDAVVQAVISAGEQSRISKLLFEATSGLRISYTGTLTTPQLTASRLLEQPKSASAALAARACSGLGKNVPSAAKVKTLDGRDYKGVRELYMPLQLSW